MSTADNSGTLLVTMQLLINLFSCSRSTALLWLRKHPWMGLLRAL